MDCDRVLSRVFVGSCPASTADIDQLKQDFGISAVLNLQSEEDDRIQHIPWPELKNHYRRSAIEARRVPVTDFDRDDLRRNLPESVAVLRELIEDGHTVYVHCTAGMGRSPTVVIAYLHWVEGWGLLDAAAHVKSRRYCSPDLEAIRLAGEESAR